MGKGMTVQEFYNWCKDNKLTDASIVICIDGACNANITEKDIVEYGKAISMNKPVSKYVMIEVQT